MQKHKQFQDPDFTADGKRRASVVLAGLETLWFNTGTLCNIACKNCYIESSPRNDRLAYITTTEVAAYLDEVRVLGLQVKEIGLTGGEPFMNPEIIEMIELCLDRGFRTLVLTNALRPMMKQADGLLALRARFGNRLVMRVSLDHHQAAAHEAERGHKTFGPTVAGLKWLSANGFVVHVAGRRRWEDSEEQQRLGFAQLFAAEGIAIDAMDTVETVLFPEMDATAPVPEITTECWEILHKDPRDVMCASSRMVVKRRGAAAPAVVACTLLPYDPAFEMGRHLADALGAVKLNHPHCAKFCVLGGGKCSR